MSALAQAMLDQADACDALGSPFMGRLMRVLAGVLPNPSRLSALLATWPGNVGARGAALPLRLAGGLHALVLLGRDPALAAAYPPQIADDATLGQAVEAALRVHDDFLCDWVQSPPQTNEVRRSAVLIAAAHWLDAHFGLPLRLSELGASAGLNLMFDTYALVIGKDRYGPEQAAITLTPDWTGPAPGLASPRISRRRGVDLNPLRVTDPADHLRLLAYLWPDQPDRIARTRIAIAGARAPVDKADAIDWLSDQLARPGIGQLHLIYHTIAWQYFPAATQARGRTLIEAAGARASPDAPLAWLSMEADTNPDGAALTVTLWPGYRRYDLGRAGFHGQWVKWAGVPADMAG
jgi:hypothetical protein